MIEVSSKTYVFFSLCLLGIGTLLALNEMLFFTYTKKILWKRTPFCDGDFFGTWLELSNLVIAFGLAVVHSHGLNFSKSIVHEFSNDLKSLPNIRYVKK